MLWKKDLTISPKLQEFTAPIFVICRLFGVLPFSLSRRGTKFVLQLSIFWITYSVAIGLVSVGLALRGFLSSDQDDSGHEATSAYVVSLKLLIEQITVVIGTCGAALRFKNFCAFASCITQIDTFLGASKNHKEATSGNTSCYRAIMVTFVTAGILIGLELKNGAPLLSFIFDVASYCVIMILECQYWCMTTTVQKRLQGLNTELLLVVQNVAGGRITLAKAGRLSGLIQVKAKSADTNGNFAHRPSIQDYEKFTKIYISLCDAVDELNDCCGLYISTIILIDLLQLTLSGYFFVIQLQKSLDYVYIILMCLSFLAYFYRLIVLVEPCQGSLQEVKQTGKLACRLLCSNIEDEPNEEVKILYEQLVQRKIEFSVYGFGNVDRSLITTIAGTVATYLVTVVQFQISEE